MSGLPDSAKRTSRTSEHASSIAVSADGEHWFLVNASPDLRQQLIATPQLHPKKGQLRHSPIAGVILTNGEIDAVAGLLSMREGSPFTIYAHERVLAILQVQQHLQCAGREEREAAGDRGRSGRSSPPCPTARHPASRCCRSRFPARAPGISKARRIPPAASGAGDTLGLADCRTRQAANIFYFLAACARVTDDLKSRLAGAPLVFFDGTVWRDDELIAAGLGNKTGQGMGHISMSGDARRDRKPCRPRHRPKGVLAYQQLQPGAAERLGRAQETLSSAGWQIPADGTEIVL